MLGRPPKTRAGQDAKLTLWDYAPDNFSLEFTSEGKLYSIQIMLDPPLREATTIAGLAEAREFAAAALSKDVNELMRSVSGDLLCGSIKSVRFTRAARIDLTDPKSQMSQCLSRAARPIAALPQEKHGVSDQMRVNMLHLTNIDVFPVTKFPEKVSVKEIVYAWECDAWRIYQVILR